VQSFRHSKDSAALRVALFLKGRVVSIHFRIRDLQSKSKKRRFEGFADDTLQL
jgi:hypothetical protein